VEFIQRQVDAIGSAEAMYIPVLHVTNSSWCHKLGHA